jgi:hypothetical protein
MTAGFVVPQPSPLLVRRFSLCGTNEPLYDLCEMLFARRSHWSLKELLHPVVGIVTVRQRPSRVLPFL